jgi:hypothetical protein
MSRTARLALGILLFLAGLASFFQAFMGDSAFIIGLAFVLIGVVLMFGGMRLMGLGPRQRA